MTVTTTKIPAAINFFYDRVMLVRATPYLVHAKWAQVRDIPTNSGVAIKWRRYNSVAANLTELNEGETPAGNTASVTDVTATVKFYGDFLLFTDVVVLTTFDPLLTELAEVLGEQAGDSLDQLCRNTLMTGSNVQYAGGKANRTLLTAEDVLTVEEVRLAVLDLKLAKAKYMTNIVSPTDGVGTTPIPASFIGIIHPTVTNYLKADPDFTPIEKYPNQAFSFENEVGKIDQVRLIETTNAKVWANGGLAPASGEAPDVFGTLIIARDFYGITRIAGNALQNIVKAIGSSGTADPLNQRGTTGWKATFVAVILNDDFGIRIEHC